MGDGRHEIPGVLHTIARVSIRLLINTIRVNVADPMVHVTLPTPKSGILYTIDGYPAAGWYPACVDMGDGYNTPGWYPVGWV